jgi:site-specific DNA-methyltransferase (adenine-specific)
LDGTLAHNTVMHGTGALHVDAVRVPFTSARDELDTAGESAPGRWPSNVLFCHHPLCEPTGGTMVVRGDRRAGVGYQPGLRPGGFLDPGTVGKGDTRPSSVRPDETVEVWDCHPNCPVGELDRQSVDARGRGTASRYFPTFCYSPKATVTERPVVDGVQHVSVKPLTVIRWLVDLVATPGGTLLDPFAGSGTLAEACIDAGVRCVVIENHEPYVPLILERIRRARGVAA